MRCLSAASGTGGSAPPSAGTPCGCRGGGISWDQELARQQPEDAVRTLMRRWGPGGWACCYLTESGGPLVWQARLRGEMPPGDYLTADDPLDLHNQMGIYPVRRVVRAAVTKSLPRGLACPSSVITSGAREAKGSPAAAVPNSWRREKRGPARGPLARAGP